MGITDEFKKFAMRGNVVDLAVGFTVGAAFATVARSLVDDVIMPPVGLLIGENEFQDMFLLLKEGVEQSPPYTTLAEAQEAGAVTLNYGLFINSVITFLIIALAMFFLIRLFNSLQEELKEEFGQPPPEPGEPSTKACPYCLTTIPYKATRCPACTSELEAEPQAGAAVS